MLTLSDEGPEAERQMRAVIFYLTTFGYIDGDFDASEKRFVRDFIERVVTHRVHAAVEETQAALRVELASKYTKHFHEVFESVDRQVRELFTEAVAKDEDQSTFVLAKLKLRCFEIFKEFSEENRELLMETVDELVNADGVVHPAEAKFRAELAELLSSDEEIELIEEIELVTVALKPPIRLELVRDNDEFFEQFEQHYSSDRGELLRQVDADRSLMTRVIELLETQRRQGLGRLKAKHSVGEFAPGTRFHDGHTQLIAPELGSRHELYVVGDLHGCYSCLKAVLCQSDFAAKVALYEQSPSRVARPHLVLLGDYIDRGLFSYNGVLRTVLQLFVQYPEYVTVLRGNHEYYIEHEGVVYGAVRPSEAMNTLKPHWSMDVFKHYIQLFDALPNVLFFDKFMFVHAGIPRDSSVKKLYRDLSSLDEWELRFQMMWSDPSSADVIPSALQEQSARFPFGRLQCQAFLNRVGCHTLIRGHEKVNEGYRCEYDDEHQRLITLFSAGGEDCSDLPADSSYRLVTPMALKLGWDAGVSEISPFLIEYRQFTDATHNRFFARPPQIAHRAG